MRGIAWIRPLLQDKFKPEHHPFVVVLRNLERRKLLDLQRPFLGQKIHRIFPLFVHFFFHGTVSHDDHFIQRNHFPAGFPFRDLCNVPFRIHKSVNGDIPLLAAFLGFDRIAD